MFREKPTDIVMCGSKRKGSPAGNAISVAFRYIVVTWLWQALFTSTKGVGANPDAKRLYDDLLSHYNRLIRPVSNNSQVVTVRLGLHLTQLIDLDLKNQILTTNVWVEHEWMDAKLTWDPEEYGGVKELMVPSDHIWLPDIVLYNNADGEYVVTTMTKASLYYDGIVKWNPPAIFKSYCEIDVRYFPFDTQTCFMKFGSWSYSGLQMDLKHIHSQENLVEIGMNLKDYYPSGEWDILDVPAERHARFYECCPNEFYADIFFNITLRRKTLFYTVNLIIPCVGISCLSVLTFYLPADSGEKVALCITTLLSQTMFFLLMSEIIPSTSLAMPLLGKYLLFTMCLVGLSVLITIVILNVRYRKPSTHKMSPWVRRFFIQQLPKMLLMRVPNQSNGNEADERDSRPSTDIPAAPSAFARDDDNDIDLAVNSFEVNTISGQQRRLEQQCATRPGSAGQMFQSKIYHHQHPHGSRLGLASSASTRSLSSATRRWSRSGSPYHYGSQLLCEIINHNAAQHQQQYREQQQQRQQQYEEERHRYGQQQQHRQQHHCRRHEGHHCYANQEERYSHREQEQLQQQQQLLLTRLPPPPLTPSPVISTITPASLPVFSPATPPLPFLIQPLSSYPSMVGTPAGPSLRHSISCSSSSGSSDGAGFPIGRSGISSAAVGSKYKTNKSCTAVAGAMALPVADIGYDGDSGCSRPTSPMDDLGALASVNNLRQRRPNRVVKRFPLELQKAIRDVQFIQNHMKREDEYDEEDNDWGFIAMVLDRFFLWVFTVASLCGTISILFTAPALYDDSKPINLKYLGELGFY